jgi:CRP-like cAMP-binding protein
MRLTDFPTFARLDGAQLERLAAIGQEQTFSPGAEIIVMDTRGDRLFFLLEGRLDVVRVEGQEERRLAVLEPPAIFGEMELLTGAPRTATIRAVTPARVLGVTFEDLRRRLDEGDVAGLQLMRGIAVALAGRLSATVDKLREIESVSAGTRKADLRDFRQKVFFDWSF